MLSAEVSSVRFIHDKNVTNECERRRLQEGGDLARVGYWQQNDTLYEILPEGSEAPTRGYTSKAYILKKMRLPDLFRCGEGKKDAVRV